MGNKHLDEQRVVVGNRGVGNKHLVEQGVVQSWLGIGQWVTSTWMSKG